MRRLTVVTVALLSAASAASAQTPASIRNTRAAPVGEVAARGVAANNPFIGAELAFKFPGSDGPRDLLLLAAKAMYEVRFKVRKVEVAEECVCADGQTTTVVRSRSNSDEEPYPFVIPVMANFSPTSLLESADAETKLRELATSSAGISAGLYPYLVLESHDDFVLTLHSVIAWRLNSLGSMEGDSTVNLQQGRFGIGLETQLGVRQGENGTTVGRHPLTVSAMFVGQVFDRAAYARVFGEKKGGQLAFELTAVAPIATGLAVMFEYAFAKEDALRLGVIAFGS